MEYWVGIVNHFGLVLLESITLLVLFLYIINNLSFLRVHWFKSLIFVVSYLLLHHIVNHFENLPLTLIYIIFCIPALFFLTKINFYTVLSAGIMVFLIYGFTEAVVSMPVTYFMGLSFPAVRNNDLLYMKSMLIIRPVQILIIALLTGFYIKPRSFSRHLFGKKNYSSLYSLLTVLIVSAFFNYITRHIYNSLVVLISGFLFLGVVLLSILEGRERLKLLEIENKLHLEKEYCRNMEQIVAAVRKEKHDFKNQISTLIALCAMPGAADQVREYAMKLANRHKLDEMHFYNTGNKYLDGLLSVKNNFAVKNGIYFDVDVEATLENIAVDDVDLTSIIGNILDNAFEAVLMNPPDKKKIVSLTIFKEDGRCCISISNNGSEIPESHKKHIFEYKFSTKSNTGGERGYGLYIVKELINRNNGEISFHSDEFETEFIVTFQYKDENKSLMGNNHPLNYDQSIFSQ